MDEEENQTFFSNEYNKSIYSNISKLDEDDSTELYIYYVPLMIVFCLISIIYNIRVLITVHWIRRPLTPTLTLSLSLAAADAFTSFLIGVGLFINSFLFKMCDYQTPCYIGMLLEISRLSGIIITVVHLLALSFNHWLGIFKPLHITTMVTTRKVVLVAILLWLLPLLFFHIYFILADQNWFNERCEKMTILHTLLLRIILSSMIVVPILLMILCYAHILYIVRRQQKIWSKLSRSGSKKCKSCIKTTNTQQQRKTMEGNVKAVYTTLLILGSCMLGWMPAVLIFILVCKEECLYTTDEAYKYLDARSRFFLAYFANFLIILKTLANPIIYASRMTEIKEGMRKMKLSARRICCKSNNRDDHYSPNFHSMQIGYSGSMNAGITQLANINGSFTKKRNPRSKYPNTPV